MTFGILVVCTGNICRSPMAERLLRHRLPADLPITVSSAGTYGLVRHAMDGPAALALRELGVDPDGHVARRLTARLCAEADLILTAESAHRSAVVQQDPRSLRRTFTLREFGRLGAALGALPDGGSVAALRQRVDDVAAQRGHVDPPEPGADEIGDPYGGSLAVARMCAGQVSEAVDAIVAALGLSQR